MKILNLAIVTIATLTIIGCGEDSSSSDKERAKGDTIGGTTTTINRTDNIHELRPYLALARNLVTGSQKTSCLPVGNGKGKVISQVISNSSIQFHYKEYSNAQCIGDIETMKLSHYSITYGNEIDGGKAIEANLKFNDGDDIVDKVPNHMLGYDIGTTFYTTIVASANTSTLEIKIGIAKPTDTNNGTSASKRANDISDYTSGLYYLSN